MTYRSSLRVGAVLLLGSALVLCASVSLPGCSQAPPPAAFAAPLSVSVSYPLERVVTDYSDFTARLTAVESVEVRAHVWGYLQKVNFKEGSRVNKGDVLFELDARPYQGMLNQAKAKVAQDEAQLKFDQAEYERCYAATRQGVGSQADLDKASAARDVDIANIAADKAVMGQHLLNLEYTKVTAPISGRISRYLVTAGNLVQSGDQSGGTLLTTIVSVDPIYAYFDIDERTVVRGRQLAREGRAKAVNDGDLPVALSLVPQDGFPHRGVINFVDNQVNPKTGTLRVRGVFPNADEALTPGFFTRVRMPMGNPHKALLVSDRALDNDQGQRILYVLDDHNKVAARPVRVGAIHDGFRAIEDGLKAGERVIVEGLQLVRPDMTVEPKLVPMPVSGAHAQEPAPKLQPGTIRAEKAR